MKKTADYSEEIWNVASSLVADVTCRQKLKSAMGKGIDTIILDQTESVCPGEHGFDGVHGEAGELGSSTTFARTILGRM